MARMKKCPECGHLNSVVELYCDECSGELSDHDRVEVNERGEHAHEVKQPARELGPQAHALDVEPSLDLPWGLVRIGRQLNVGRDAEFSPIAGEIHDLHVSNRHAELRWDGSRLVVRHVGATNPTFVNARALATGEEATLGDGDTIGFSRHLTAVVRLKHTR